MSPVKMNSAPPMEILKTSESSFTSFEGGRPPAGLVELDGPGLPQQRGQLDMRHLEDPAYWAMTWRAYQKKRVRVRVEEPAKIAD